jgi:Fur family peroxide stress response transcriptional regulator
MTTPQNRLNQMVAKLRAQNMRITPQRLAILSILAASEGHPSIEDIYDRLKVSPPFTRP